ncbi:Suppressor of lurcher protein 1 [Orchesella cincta]|uniref:Suppressor of lurcher protein 1 n=1 Tax=Orchesella cincta TaxID=48709 RepID=A0A1D2MFS8_ORCCI|nr:Suppressor of lurcher protein 1 [Orchesella cincta]
MVIKRCIPVVTSDNSKSGNFSSPNYPRYYPQHTHCRYDFVGHANERVQVVFTDFNLFHPDDGYTQRDPDRPRNLKEIERARSRGRDLDCSATDVDILSAFVYSNLENKLARIDDFCGSTPPLAVMSNGNRLTLEFKAPSSSTYVRGFSALYRFVTDFGITNGRQDPHLPCRFYFHSNETSNGTFTSPNYPGLYPRDTECHYFFQGRENEHVELHFTYFHIDGVQPCDEDTYSDYVEFSNYIPTDRKYDRKCGTESGFKVRSDRKFFRVNFHSNDRYDATGFQATYQFSDKTNHLTIRNVRSSSEKGSQILLPVFVMIFFCNFLLM